MFEEQRSVTPLKKKASATRAAKKKTKKR